MVRLILKAGECGGDDKALRRRETDAAAGWRDRIGSVCEAGEEAAGQSQAESKMSLRCR
jgi:hypothetical protein